MVTENKLVAGIEIDKKAPGKMFHFQLLFACTL